VGAIVLATRCREAVRYLHKMTANGLSWTRLFCTVLYLKKSKVWVVKSVGQTVHLRGLAFGGHSYNVRSLVVTCHFTTRQAETLRFLFTSSTCTQLYSTSSLKNEIHVEAEDEGQTHRIMHYSTYTLPEKAQS
jgi:hypothetical protein